MKRSWLVVALLPFVLAGCARAPEYDVVIRHGTVQMRLPWVSFGSDAASMAPEGVFIKTSTHPRSYGNFARLLGKYVRDEHVITLEEAIRKLTSLPAATLRIKERGQLAPGYLADVVVFDPKTIGDRSTYEQPHQYSTGVRHVGQRRAGVERRRAHGCETRPRRSRARVEGS